MQNLILLAILVAIVGLGTLVSWVFGLVMLLVIVVFVGTMIDKWEDWNRRRGEHQIDMFRRTRGYSPKESEGQRIRRELGID
ncbi:MAG: hypothetical protein V9E94_14845 [Microthrixaceae bacterium]